MQSSDPGHFFETDAEQATRQRRAAKAGNKYGNPITLKSKILAAVVDPRAPSSTILVAESAGSVRRVNVDSGDTSTVYRGPTAPVCCVAVGGPASKPILFAGCWDKAIWSWDLASKAPGRKYLGHSDFVNAVVCARIGGKDCLISGGADHKIMVWDVSSGARLHTLQDSVINMLKVQDLVVDPAASSEDGICLVSASSDPHIRRWMITLDSWEQVTEPAPAEEPGAERRAILEHETTVYKLVFDHDRDELDLWTSSGDGTAKCLSRMKGFTPDDSYTHGDHVRAVAVANGFVVTAGRDENVKFWDQSLGELFCSLEGHFDEITDLAILRGPDRPGARVCSVSIDGTVRTWPLITAGLQEIMEQQAKPATNDVDEDKTGEEEENLLTADEEAELAALMDDD
ncbi:WD40-repeat-containing domain protein [Diplogelasinospora grovesii]|uniref:WD40-repeat-containing domain protein n=1 Tax=Diplogelasinospora grovesii TaxID=303347 RepID=A0AAN6SAR5_9PEZI|nr:WD40-repeat-containing domain protein [Diplogelasinospora grovesii]